MKILTLKASSSYLEALLVPLPDPMPAPPQLPTAIIFPPVIEISPAEAPYPPPIPAANVSGVESLS